jgi:hypothetical protein
MYLCFVLLVPWRGHNSIEHVVSLQMLMFATWAL